MIIKMHYGLIFIPFILFAMEEKEKPESPAVFQRQRSLSRGFFGTYSPHSSPHPPRHSHGSSFASQDHHTPAVTITSPSQFADILAPYTTGCHPQTIAVFDIDDTVGTPCGPSVLKAEAFGDNQYAAEIIFPDITAGHLHAKIIEALLNAHQHAELRPFDKKNTVAKTIEALQRNGIKAIGLTARSTPLRDITLKQLSRLNISFSSHEESKPISITEQTPQIEGYSKKSDDTPLTQKERKDLVSAVNATPHQPAIFTKGILFCGDNPKGPMLKQLFRKLKLAPQHIIYADDSERNIFSVMETFPEQTLPILMRITPDKPPLHVMRSDFYVPEIPRDDHILIGTRLIPRSHLFPFILDQLRKSYVDEGTLRHHNSMRNLDPLDMERSSDGGSPLGSPSPTIPLTSHTPGEDPFAQFRSAVRLGRK
jgi:hypothetical protein